LAFQATQVSFVLKLDTDSVVIGPFLERIMECFYASRDVGLLGSCFRYDLIGNPVPPSTWKGNLTKHKNLVRLRRRPFPRIEFSFWGRKRARRLLLLQALRNGWPLGACAQGGGYAVRRELFDVCWANGWLADDLLWLDTDLGEDVVSSLLCFAAGFQVADLNGPNGVFGVQSQGLGLSLEQFTAHRHSILHSVKMKNWEDELALRRRIKSMYRG
jgi:hypothetical protein